MSDARPEDPVRVGAKLALGIAVAATVLLTGAMAGPPGAIVGLVGGLGAVGVAAALRALVRTDNRSRALGSVGLAAGGLGVLGAAVGLVVAGRLPTTHPLGHAMTNSGDVVVLVLAVGGTLAAATDAFVESPASALDRLSTTLWRSGHVLVVGVVLGYLAALGLFSTLPLLLAVGGADLLAVAGRPTEGGGLVLALSVVALEVLAVLAVWLVRLAVPVLSEWAASAAAVREADLDLDRLLVVLPDPAEFPAAVWALLAAQLFVALYLADAVGGLVAAVLDVLGPVGALVRAVVASGLLHWPLVAVVALALTVLAANWLRSVVAFWAGSNPPTTLAFAAGGIAAVALGWSLGLFATGVEVATGVDAGAHVLATGIPVLAGVGMFVAAVLAAAPERVAAVAGLRRASGFGGGAALLFVAGLFVALYGVPGGATDAPSAAVLVPLAAVAGVAASVLVWDLGQNAVALRTQLGRETDTREVELTHAVASLLVAGGAVVLAALAYYLAGPLLFSSVSLGPLELSGGLVDISTDRALVALGLAIVALLAFGFLVDRGQELGPK